MTVDAGGRAFPQKSLERDELRASQPEAVQIPAVSSDEAPDQLPGASAWDEAGEQMDRFPEHSAAEVETCAPLPALPFPAKVVRSPNLGDALLFLAMLALGLLVTMGLLGLALHYHWFGLRNAAEAANDTRVTVLTEVLLYGFALAGAVPFFGMVWDKGYFAGIHWHAQTARRLWPRLAAIAFLGNVMAALGNMVLPFPEHAPVDKMFASSSDAWLLLVFGVTVAPFFEEMIFRGFLLPAVATAWDWCVERATHRQPNPLDDDGNPVWSRAAMIAAALTVSAPFALIHAEQVGKAWGPLLLLYCVSLILCAVRLATRSLAASTLVHSAYNFMLFAAMLWQTGGFRHMDKM